MVNRESNTCPNKSHGKGRNACMYRQGEMHEGGSKSMFTNILLLLLLLL